MGQSHNNLQFVTLTMLTLSRRRCADVLASGAGAAAGAVVEAGSVAGAAVEAGSDVGAEVEWLLSCNMWETTLDGPNTDGRAIFLASGAGAAAGAVVEAGSVAGAAVEAGSDVGAEVEWLLSKGACSLSIFSCIQGGRRCVSRTEAAAACSTAVTPSLSALLSVALPSSLVLSVDVLCTWVYCTPPSQI